MARIDAVARGEAEPHPVTPAQAVLVSVTGALYTARQKDTYRESIYQLHGTTEADREMLLRTSREMWDTVPSLPLYDPEADPRSLWQQGLTMSLRYGDGLFDGLVQKMLYECKGHLGLHVDTRDATTIAERFLARVEQLEGLPGGDTSSAIVRARDEVLDGVPASYVPRVIERILDVEERRAEPEQAEELRGKRNARRENALSMLKKGGWSRGRQR